MLFTQSWQTDNPHTHRCYSRILCKKWRQWKFSWKALQHKSPALLCHYHCMDFSLVPPLSFIISHPHPPLHDNACKKCTRTISYLHKWMRWQVASHGNTSNPALSVTPHPNNHNLVSYMIFFKMVTLEVFKLGYPRNIGGGCKHQCRCFASATIDCWPWW